MGRSSRACSEPRDTSFEQRRWCGGGGGDDSRIVAVFSFCTPDSYQCLDLKPCFDVVWSYESTYLQVQHGRGGICPACAQAPTRGRAQCSIGSC